MIEICQFHVNLIARVWQNFKFWTANPQTAPSQTIACKNNETFHIFGHFKVRRPPPAPMINVGKLSGLNFLFSVIHTTLNWGEGAFRRKKKYLWFRFHIVKKFATFALKVRYHGDSVLRIIKLKIVFFWLF